MTPRIQRVGQGLMLTLALATAACGATAPPQKTVEQNIADTVNSQTENCMLVLPGEVVRGEGIPHNLNPLVAPGIYPVYTGTGAYRQESHPDRYILNIGVSMPQYAFVAPGTNVEGPFQCAGWRQFIFGQQ